MIVCKMVQGVKDNPAFFEVFRAELRAKCFTRRGKYVHVNAKIYRMTQENVSFTTRKNEKLKGNC